MVQIKQFKMLVLILFSILSSSAEISDDTTKTDTIITERAISDFSRCIISGNVSVYRCWISSYNFPSKESKLKLFKNALQLKEFWHFYRIKMFDPLPEMPTIDFKDKMIIVIEPETTPIFYCYSINLLEKPDTILVEARQYRNQIGSRFKGKYGPKLIFEIPRSDKIFTLKVIKDPSQNEGEKDFK